MIDINKIKDDVEIMLLASNWSHDFEHTLRVYNLAVHIWKIEWADMDVLEVAALMHDVARHIQDKSAWKICHAEKWAEEVIAYLSENGFEELYIENVAHAVRCHRYRWQNVPKTLEAKILFDADKLDWLWAIWIWRSFHFAWEHSWKLHDPIPNLSPEAEYTEDDTPYREFLIKWKKMCERLFTEEAKKIAAWRYEFMNDFFQRLNKEYNWDF